MTIEVRRMVPGDEPALWDALYYAIHVPPGEMAPARSVIHEPAILRYYPSFDVQPDLGYLAVQGSKPIGAAWLRVWSGMEQGYGFVDARTPEVSIAVWPGHRGQGVGTRLLEQLLSDARSRWEQVALSVAKTNHAKRLYERTGFVTIREDESAYLMLWRPGDSSSSSAEPSRPSRTGPTQSR